MAIELSDKLFDISDSLEQRKLYRFAEQLRGSTFENANISFILNKRKLLEEKELNYLLDQLDILCRKITNFQKSLD